MKTTTLGRLFENTFEEEKQRKNKMPLWADLLLIVLFFVVASGGADCLAWAITDEPFRQTGEYWLLYISLMALSLSLFILLLHCLIDRRPLADRHRVDIRFVCHWFWYLLVEWFSIRDIRTGELERFAAQPACVFSRCFLRRNIAERVSADSLVPYPAECVGEPDYLFRHLLRPAFSKSRH